MNNMALASGVGATVLPAALQLNHAGSCCSSSQQQFERRALMSRSSSRVLLGSHSKSTISTVHDVSRSRVVVARASNKEGEHQQGWDIAKKAGVAAAVALVLTASPLQITPAAYAVNADAGAAAKEILKNAKEAGNEAFSAAQKSGQETVGQANSAPEARPAISQVDPSAPEAADTVGDKIEANANLSAEAPATDQQQGKTGRNPFVKLFGTPIRGVGDKSSGSATGENESSATGPISSLNDSDNKLPGTDNSLGQNPRLIDGVREAFRAAEKGTNESLNMGKPN